VGTVAVRDPVQLEVVTGAVHPRQRAVSTLRTLDSGSVIGALRRVAMVFP
jgi:hypothetical protein